MDWHHFIPFGALFSQQAADLPNRPLLTRLVEQATVGVVAAAIGLYANDLVMKDQITNLAQQVADVKQTQAASVQDLKQMISQMQRDLYVPRSK